MVSNVRRFTGVGDDITFLHDLGTLLDRSDNSLHAGSTISRRKLR